MLEFGACFTCWVVFCIVVLPCISCLGWCFVGCCYCLFDRHGDFCGRLLSFTFFGYIVVIVILTIFCAFIGITLVIVVMLWIGVVGCFMCLVFCMV